MIKYSVIIPVYNLAKYIEKTLEAFSAATENTEIILVDDGSLDDSLKLINSYVENSNASNIKVYSQSNQGVSVARNKGIEEASGEYLIFADGDDYLSLDCIRKLEGKDSDIVVWRYETEKNGIKTISQSEFDRVNYTAEEFVESLLRGKNRIRIGSFAVKRELIEQYDIRFTPGCAICEDVEFMYKMILAASDVTAMNDNGYTYVRREGSAINTFDMKRFQAPVAIRRIYQYATKLKEKNFSEYVMESLNYGLFITHAMYSFDSCCRYIKDSSIRKQFLVNYFKDYSDIEEHIKEAKKNMKYKPEIYSKKRLFIFLLSRKIYTTFVSR